MVHQVCTHFQSLILAGPPEPVADLSASDVYSPWFLRHKHQFRDVILDLSSERLAICYSHDRRLLTIACTPPDVGEDEEDEDAVQFQYQLAGYLNSVFQARAGLTIVELRGDLFPGELCGFFRQCKRLQSVKRITFNDLIADYLEGLVDAMAASVGRVLRELVLQSEAYFDINTESIRKFKRLEVLRLSCRETSS